MLKETSVKVDKAKVVLRAGRGLFARMVAMAQTRSFELKKCLQYEPGPIPWSVATGDGCLAKTQESKMLTLLEGYASPVEDVPFKAWSLLMPWHYFSPWQVLLIHLKVLVSTGF